MPGATVQTPEPEAATNSSVVARLCDFIDTLPESIALKLLDAIDHMALAGEPFPMTDVIAAQLRKQIDLRTRTRERVVMPSRLFFKPIDPFIVDGVVATKGPARISRSSLSAIWAWMRKDAMPSQIEPYEKHITELLVEDDLKTANLVVAELQKLATQVVGDLLEFRGNEKAERKIAARLGGDLVLADAREMFFVFSQQETLKILDRRVIGPIRNVDEQQAALIIQALAGIIRDTPSLLVYAGVLVMTKLTQPWQIVKVVTLACETDLASRISESPWGVLIETLLGDLDRHISRAEIALSNQDFGTCSRAIREFAGIVRTLESDIDLTDHRWQKRLGPPRAKMGKLIQNEIDPLPGRVRRLLRISTSKDGVADRFDEFEAKDAVTGIDLLMTVRPFAAELALNEPTRRAQTDIDAYLETMISALIEAVRTAHGAQRASIIRRLDFATQIAPHFLGKGYSAQLEKSIEVATSGEWKAPKAA